MSTPIDWSKPFTDEDIERLKKIPSTFPTYRADDGNEPYFLSSDVETCLRAMNYYRDAEQCETYKKLWDEHYGGVVTMSRYMETVIAVNQGASKASLVAGAAWDKDGDGYISREEFKEFVEFMAIHEPKLKGFIYDFDKFVEEADSNQDGLVSLQEFATWIKDTLLI